MTATAPTLRARRHRALAAGTVLALAISLIGMANAASAADTQTWTLSGVTFQDGGQMTGTFEMSDAGVMSAQDITTSGGNTAAYGASTTYDDASSDVYQQGGGEYFVPFTDWSRYMQLYFGDLSGAEDGDVVPLSLNRSWECLMCSPYRYVTGGSIVAGPSAAPPSVTGTPTITGNPQVGQTLTGHDSGVTATPQGATKSHKWLRDGAPIQGATGNTHALTNDDAGHSIAFQVSATLDGYPDASPVTSTAVGPIDGGQITLPTPTIDGTPVVDGILSASLPDGLDPADATVAWQWYRGATPVGDGSSTYSPGADDVGQVLTVKADATKASFDDATKSVDTAQVAKATFSSPPVATIDGVSKVGETLTAGTGTVTPAPDQLAYQWYINENPIGGATDPTFELTAAHRHSTMTVRVTASRSGYDDAAATSDPTGDVATELAPDLSFDATDTTIRRGEDSTLDWNTVDADTVEAAGAWAGSKPTSGTATVSPSSLGQTTYGLVATNANGTTTGEVTVSVGRPARGLRVSATGGLHLAGTAIRVNTWGLEGGEQYAISIAGTRVATGNATASGGLSRAVRIPTGTGDRTAAVTVTGSEGDRTGSTTTRVVVNKTLGLRLAKSVVRPRHRQWVGVSGLAAGEQVSVAYRGVRISPRTAHADSRGSYVAIFRVGRLQGTKHVTVTGAFQGRTATKTFRLKRH